MQLILLGAPISAVEAHSIGLVAELCDPGLALQTAVQTASKLASKSSHALALAKAAILRGKSSL